MNKITKFFVVAISALILNGCGNSEPITENTAPFEKAIAKYCRAKSYGMKVKKFVSLKVTADKADAVAKMQEAGGTYGISVKWEFKFQKQNGKWKALSHNAK